MRSIVINIALLFVVFNGFSMWNAPAQANTWDKNTSLEELLELSLEQLMQVKIQTVSKSTEDLYSAPGIASIISAEEIRRFGGNSLYEILDRAASIYMGGSILYPRNSAVIRGDQVNGLDRHVLVLVNGKSLRNTLSGGINFPIYNAFPISIIERLEIIRGPGSVLYGTNAFSGVINIVTKDKPSSGHREGEITVSGGSHQTKQVDGYAAFNADRLYLSGGIRYSQEDGWDFNAVDVKNRQGSMKMGQENLGMTLSGHYRNAHFNITSVGSTENYMGVELQWGDELFEMANNRSLFNAGYEWKFNDSQRLTADLTYNFSTSHARNKTTLSSETAWESGVLELNHYWNRDKFSWLSGVNVEHARDRYLRYWSPLGPLNNPPPQPPYKDTIYMIYSQLDYTPNPNTQWTIGGQVVKNPNQDWKFIPRLGVVHHFTKSYGGKLLFSEAYRAASPVERDIQLPVVYGNPLLAPETVQTLDAQLFYQHAELQASLTYFYTRQRDLIVRRPIAPNSIAQYHFNQDQVNISGLELETRFTPLKGWYVTGSLTYQKNENKAGKEDVTLAPNWLAKLGISYQFSSGATFSAFDSYVGAAPEVPTSLPLNPHPDAHHLITVTMQYPFGQWLGLKKSQDILLNAYLYNVLDEKIYAPEVNTRSVNSIPSRSGRSVHLGFQYQF